MQCFGTLWGGPHGENKKKTSGKKTKKTKKSYFLGTLWGGLDGENLKKTKKGKNIKTYRNPKKHIF